MATPPIGSTVKVTTPPLGGVGTGLASQPPAQGTNSLDVGGGTSVLESLARGAAQGFTAKWGDEIQGAIQASLPQPGDPATWGERYDRQVAAARADDERAKKSHPGYYHGADFAASLPAAIATGGGASVGARVAAAGAFGGLSGAGAGEGARGKALGAGLGTALGAGGQYALGELLFPWLAGKAADRADNLLLQRVGVSRKQYRDMQKRLTPEEYETTVGDMADMVRSGRVAKAPGANLNEKAYNATEEAGNTVRGFLRQADEAAPWSPGLTQADLGSMRGAITQGGRPQSYGGEAAAERAAREVDQLRRHIAEGNLGHENAHDVLLGIGEHAFPNGQPAANVSQHQFARMTQTGKEALRANAKVNQPPGGGPVTPEAFDSSIADYSKLLDLRKAAQASTAREDSLPGFYAAVRNFSPLIMGALGLGGTAAAHGGALTQEAALAGLGTAAAVGAFKSPAIMHATGQALSPVAGAVGRGSMPGMVDAIIGQPDAAELYAHGVGHGTNYTPPTPLRSTP
jgi:hypothetical protein